MPRFGTPIAPRTRAARTRHDRHGRSDVILCVRGEDVPAWDLTQSWLLPPSIDELVPALVATAHDLRKLIAAR